MLDTDTQSSNCEGMPFIRAKKSSKQFNRQLKKQATGNVQMEVQNSMVKPQRERVRAFLSRFSKPIVGAMLNFPRY